MTPDPNDKLVLKAYDANDELLAEHECRPSPAPETPAWAECFRAFAAKVAEALEG